MYRKIALFTLLATASVIAGAAGNDHRITQKNKTFSEKEITISVGDTITFGNEDNVVHNVFSNTPGMEFDLRTQKPGEASTVPFEKEGQCEVRCAIHTKMKLIVNVTK